MRTLCKALHGCLVALLLVVLATPCYAMSRPVTKPVDSMEAFLAEYRRGSNSTAVREYFSRVPLLCVGDVVLTGGGGRVDLVALAGVRVTGGSVVHWDDPELNIIGYTTVERGGTLHIQNWNPMMTNGVMPTADMIRVEPGGNLQVAEGITLPAGMVIVEEEPPPNTLPPPEPVPDPVPEPEPERIAVAGIFEPILYRSCGTGYAYAAALPATVKTYLVGGLARELDVCWDLSAVDWDTPGTYLVYGNFVSESLADNGASNPNDIRPAVSLTLLASTPMRDLSWRAIGSSGASVPTLQLAFGALPADVEHLYLSSSADGVNWKRCVRTDAMGNPDGEDFLSAVRTIKATSFLIYRMPAGFDVLYLRLEVNGSVCDGSSNPIRIQHSDFGGALGSGGPNSDADDGGSEGNRGGGQGTFDREGQKDPVQTPSPPDAAVETTPPPEAQPEQELHHESEAEAVQVEQESNFSGNTYSGGTYGYAHLSQKTEQIMASENLAAKETAPEQQPADEGAHLDEAAVKAQPPTSSEESAAQVQPLTVESEYTAPQGDGDTSGLVAAATLAVCLFTAAGLYLLHKRSLKRKS